MNSKEYIKGIKLVLDNSINKGQNHVSKEDMNHISEFVPNLMQIAADKYELTIKEFNILPCK